MYLLAVLNVDALLWTALLLQAALLMLLANRLLSRVHAVLR